MQKARLLGGYGIQNLRRTLNGKSDVRSSSRMCTLNRKKLLLALPILSLLWFTATIVIAGLFYPDYSHSSQFISELGATGSPYGNYVNYLGFIPTELFIIAFVFICFSVLPKSKTNLTGLFFIGIYGLSLGVSALFPCDYGCRPIEPTLSHNIHMISAFPGYLCGIISIFIISSGSSVWVKSKTFKVFSYLMGTLCIYSFLNLDPESNFVGVFQRCLDLMIYAWFIYFSYILSKNLPNN